MSTTSPRSTRARGLRPELTGRGLGGRAIATGLEYGAARFRPAAFRVTVAGFNLRAQWVVQGLGFVPAATFEATVDGRDFVILTRRERWCSEAEGTPRPGGFPPVVVSLRSGTDDARRSTAVPASRSRFPAGGVPVGRGGRPRRLIT